MKVEITTKKVLAALAVLAWIFAFVQMFNAIWTFWPYPSETVNGFSGRVYVDFRSDIWWESAAITVLAAVALVIVWALVKEA